MNGSNGNGHNGHSNGHANGHDRFADPPPNLDDDEEPVVPPSQPKSWKFPVFPTESFWLEREIEPPDCLLGEVLATDTRMMLAGPTGQGKTMLALAIAGHVAAGISFLHWSVPRARRVVYVEGEMSRRLTQERIADAARRRGVRTDNLIVLSRADYPDMPPLNTAEGQAFIAQFLEHIGHKQAPVGLMMFDNLQALLDGDMKEPHQWAQMKRWQQDLTSDNICQVYLHHTNDDGTIYGDKTRLYQLDTAAIMTPLDEQSTDIGFNLKFIKARERSPRNRADFEPVVITLDNDQWTSSRGSSSAHSGRPPADAETTRMMALAAIDEALAKGPEHVFGHPTVAPDVACAKVSLCLKYFLNRYPAEAEKTSRNKFFTAVRSLNGKIQYFKNMDVAYVHRQ